MKRTITVQTLDHGPVTITEPAWCTATHHPDGVARSDISHYGPEAVVNVTTPRGTEELLSLRLAQYPFAQLHGTRVCEAVAIVGDSYLYDVAGLDQLANDLFEAARRVRLAANRLAIENPLGGGR